MTDKKKSTIQDDQSLVTVPQNKMLTYQEVEQIGKAFVASGMFGRDIDRVSKAITKIMAGQELGMAPFAAMRAIHVIEGNATLSANTMAAMIKRSGRYDYEVKEKSATKCVIDFFETRGGTRRKIGTETFDEEEAKAAGLLNKNNWRNYPKSMMFARCMSNGVRTYAPDVFNGMLVYTPDEMGGKVDLSGDYVGAIDGEVVEPTDKPKKAENGAEHAKNPETPVEIPDDVPEDDVEQTPPLVIDDDFKTHVQEQVQLAGLNTNGLMWFMAKISGRPFAKWEQLNDEDWRRAYDLVMAILEAKVEVSDHHLKGFEPPPAIDPSEPMKNQPTGLEQIQAAFPGAEEVPIKEAQHG